KTGPSLFGELAPAARHAPLWIVSTRAQGMNVRDDVSPWSFFMPVTLAVLVGVLAADGVRYALGTTSGDDEAAVQAQGDDPRPPDAVPPALDARGGDPVDPRVVAERTSAGAVVPERAPAGDAALSAE